MRLPTDATLIAGAGADPALLEAWREERLPIVALDPEELPAALEALATATLVVAGEGAAQAAGIAAQLGFRTFLVVEVGEVGEAEAPEGARSATLAQTLEAARAARNRERWKAARAAAR